MAALIRPTIRRAVERRIIDLAPRPERPVIERPSVGLTTVILQSGDPVEIGAIATPEEGRAVLDDLDASILSIECQLADFEGDPEWRKRAQRALKVRKLQRPRVQERIGILKAQDRSLAHVNRMAANGQQIDAKRGAFVKAAYALLGHERCAELWAHAKTIAPDAFDDEAA